MEPELDACPAALRRSEDRAAFGVEFAESAAKGKRTAEFECEFEFDSFSWPGIAGVILIAGMRGRAILRNRIRGTVVGGISPALSALSGRCARCHGGGTVFAK